MKAHENSASEIQINLSVQEAHKLSDIIRAECGSLIAFHLSYPNAKGVKHDIKILHDLLAKLEGQKS